ncbi:MAG TPA: cytochrome c oxidase subunit II, partial [Sphingomonas sp.]|nr:cytochrome c oxidase subunit II [Sphingomonas sp.]
MTGLKTIIAAAGLVLAGSGAVAAPANTAAPAAAATTGTAPSATAPAPAAAAAPAAKPADPLLAADGTPLITPVEHVGQPSDGWFGMQTQVTPTGRQARHFHDVWLVPLITV